MDKKAYFVLAYFFYFLSSTHQALSLSAIFSTPKMAGEVGTFFMVKIIKIYNKI